MSDPARRQNKTLARFRRTAEDFPQRTAVRAADGTLSFAELERRTSRLATVLVSEGISRGDRVGICLERGTGLVVALLAAWRAGAAYVPLDPEYPPARLAYMVGEASLKALITERHQELATGAAVVDPTDVPEAGLPAAALDGAAESDAAYVIFTSGSTGKPKGVEVSHRAVASLIAALEDAGAYAPEPRVAGWNASVAFDASVKQWTRVCRGDTVVVLGDDERKDAGQLALALDRYGVDDLDLTPSHWTFLRETLLSRPSGRVLRLLMGGEAIPRHMWRELADARRRGVLECLNLYGPTECTVDATVGWITGDTPGIGTALPDGRLYVLDDDLRKVPDGVEGELFIAGPRLARGYVKRPAATAERFLADPFGEPGARMYRTGDRVTRREDGTFAYLGRVDRQAKVRGYRIEPAEVESVLGQHQDIAAVRVIAWTDGVTTHGVTPHGDRLTAYVVPAGSSVPAAEVLRKYASAFLPEFMVPTTFVSLPALPLTPNGKLDEAALPAPAEGPAVTRRHHAPQTEIEALITGVWGEVLGLTAIDAGADFFALGGHSMTAIRVVARLKKSLGPVITTKDIYLHSRLDDFAAYIESLLAEPGGVT